MVRYCQKKTSRFSKKIFHASLFRLPFRIKDLLLLLLLLLLGSEKVLYFNISNIHKL